MYFSMSVIVFMPVGEKEGGGESRRVGKNYETLLYDGCLICLNTYVLFKNLNISSYFRFWLP